MGVRVDDQPGHLSGIADRALLDVDDARLIKRSSVHMHQCACVHIIDSVSERPKISMAVNVGHCPDALCIISDPDTDLIAPALVLLRLYRHLHGLAIPLHRQNDRISSALLDHFDHFILLFHICSVDLTDIIAGLHNIFSGRTAHAALTLKLARSDDENTVRLDIDADRRSHRYQLLILDDLDAHLLHREKSEQLHLHLIGGLRIHLHSDSLTQVNVYGSLRYIALPTLTYADNIRLRGDTQSKGFLFSGTDIDDRGNAAVYIIADHPREKCTTDDKKRHKHCPVNFQPPDPYLPVLENDNHLPARLSLDFCLLPASARFLVPALFLYLSIHTLHAPQIQTIQKETLPRSLCICRI